MGKNKGKKKEHQVQPNDCKEDIVVDPHLSSPPGLSRHRSAHVRVAKSPFDLPSRGTIAVLTSNGTTFFVNEGLLSLSSTYFREQLSGRTCDADPPHSLSCPCKSYTFDIILRFLYPINSPEFKDISECISISDLPYCIMPQVHADAKALGMDHVCSLVLDAAKNAASSQIVPKSGQAAIRIYAVACTLNLDPEYKIKAARSCLYVPLEADLHDALRPERVSDENIDALEEFRAQCYEEVHRLLHISEEDAHPDGLSDVIASFVSCPRCSKADFAGENENPMRAGAAQWWQDFVRRALERLRNAPMDQSIFFEEFVQRMYWEAKGCSSCSKVVHWKWSQVMSYLICEITRRISMINISIHEQPAVLPSSALPAKIELAPSADLTSDDGNDPATPDMTITPLETRPRTESEQDNLKEDLERTLSRIEGAIGDALVASGGNGASVDDLFLAMTRVAFQ